jgi:hypothetical protein
MVVSVATWGDGSFENDAASEWFFVVEEAVDPGSVIGTTLDSALAEADQLELDFSSEAVAAAELAASCAGNTPERIPDHILIWVQTHPHQPHDSEIERAVQVVARVRDESDMRRHWEETADDAGDSWRGELDDLIERLRRSGAGEPATLSP